MKKYLLFILLFCAFISGFSQSISVGAGINYGGPLPTEFVDSATAKPIPGLTAGVSYFMPISKRFSFSPALYYSFRGIEYSQTFTRDTLVTVVFNNITGQVPSFYTAHVNGAMRLHYIDINLLFTYRVWKAQMIFGPYFSLLLAGEDVGNVLIVIGRGGFFDDYTENYNNFSAIRKLEQGLMIGSNIPLYKKLSFELRVSRSFFSLYRPGKLPDRGQGGGKMFNTFVHVGLVYKIKSKL